MNNINKTTVGGTPRMLDGWDEPRCRRLVALRDPVVVRGWMSSSSSSSRAFISMAALTETTGACCPVLFVVEIFLFAIARTSWLSW